MNWDMRPLDGIGPLRFGMTPQEVGAVLNAIEPVSSSSVEDGGFVRELRGVYMPISHYRNGKLFLVDTHVGVPRVTIYNEDVYSMNSRRLLQLLEEKNGGAELDYGFVVFDRIGINTGSFYDVKSGGFYEPGASVQDDRGIAIYQPSPDTKIAGLTPFSFVDR